MAAQDLQPGMMLHGFHVDAVTRLDDLRATLVELGHQASGARLCHLRAEDQENAGLIAFRTPPPDDTGLPHILEHTVLCGSKTYPVKDPFVELLKTSLATHLNAFTMPDCTGYPFSSMNRRDFFNLADVYCDAVFHPLLTREHFMQEGHHLAFETPGDTASPLVLKGIVYSEMCGAYASLEGRIHREMTRTLFPDTAYGRDYGGDPAAIPTLTYEQFAAFHRKYYHPSNACIFVFGAIPTEEHAAYFGRLLAPYTRQPVVAETGVQRRWAAPVRRTIPYPVAAGEGTERKTAVMLAFFTNEITNPQHDFAMKAIDYYLLGNAGAPLRKALIDARLGEGLTRSGYVDYQRDAYFCVGLKGTEPERADEIAAVVTRTLERLVEQGLDKAELAAAFHQMELAARRRVSVNPGYLLHYCLHGWLYGLPPAHFLRMNEHLAALRASAQDDARCFRELIRSVLIGNPHRALLTFVPDAACHERERAAMAASLEARKRRMTPAELERTAAEAARLDALQSTPNPPEALATLPVLSLADVPRQPHDPPGTVESFNGTTFIATDLFTNGVTYVTAAFDLRVVDESLDEWLPLYAEAFTKMGAGGMDYATMARREAACSGGTVVRIDADGRVGDPACHQPLFMTSSSALDTRLDDMLAIIQDRLLALDLGDTRRLRDVVLQKRAQLRTSLSDWDTFYACSFAARGLTPNARFIERTQGVSRVRLFDRMADGFDAHAPEALRALEQLRAAVPHRGRLVISATGDRAQLGRVRDWARALSARLPCAPRHKAAAHHHTVAPACEGLAIPTSVAANATVLPLGRVPQELMPALLFISSHLSYGYLWEHVRVKGTAYHVRASYDLLNGLFSFVSGDDPQITATLAVFDRAIDHVRTAMDLSPAALEKAIVGTFRKLDKPLRGADACEEVLLRHISGESHAFRSAFRRRLLALTAGDVRRACDEVLAPALERKRICVVSSKENLERLNADAASPRFAVQTV
ncbi:hypothetical protein GX586_02400 [bacterium]|nr:hypothetical protein [bacterium]